MSQNAGLYGKYIVQKADGSDVDPNADYFVLRLDTDPAAQRAALRYADIVRVESPRLAEDLRDRVLQHCKRTTPPTGQALEVLLEALRFKVVDVSPIGEKFEVTFSRWLTADDQALLDEHGLYAKAFKLATPGGYRYILIFGEIPAE